MLLLSAASSVVVVGQGVMPVVVTRVISSGHESTRSSFTFTLSPPSSTPSFDTTGGSVTGTTGATVVGAFVGDNVGGLAIGDIEGDAVVGDTVDSPSLPLSPSLSLSSLPTQKEYNSSA